MSSFQVAGEFPATHRIRIDARGTLEPLHAHAWRVRAWLRCDHGGAAARRRAEAVLEAWIERHEGRCFNDVAPFDEVNPTAEEVARVLCRHLDERVPDAVVERVEVGEALGFSATYWPSGLSG